MAGSYTFLTAEATIQVLGTDVVQDAERFTFQAQPSGVVFHVVLAPPDTWTPQMVGGFAGALADYLNAQAGLPNVTGIASVQEIDQLNQLHDAYLIGVRSTSGKSESIINVGGLSLIPGGWEVFIETEVARLDAVEAL